MHCYIRVEGEEYKKRELGLDQICDILGQMAEAGVIYLGLTGGEPLLRPDFKDIYLFAKRKNFAVSVVTNATLITEDMIDFFEEYPPIMLEISVYGVTPQTYEGTTCTKGSFEHFQKTLEMLKRTKIRYLPKFVIMKTNYEESIKNKDILKKNSRGCLPLVSRKDKDHVKNALIKRQRLSPQEVIEVFHSLGKDYRTFQRDNRYVDTCCGESLAFAITPYGGLIMCGYRNEPNTDLNRIKFIDAWNSYKIEKTPLMKQEIACGDCEFKACCVWCPGIAYLETGSTEKKVPYLCQVMQALKEDVDRKIQTEKGVCIHG